MRPARILAGLAAMALAAVSVQAAPGTAVGPRERPDVIVRFDPGTPTADRAAALDTVDVVGQRALAGVPRTVVAEFPVGAPVGTALSELRMRPGVAWAVPNARVRLAVVPDDSQYGTLWGMPDIGAATAWDATRGSADVVVGVVDTGASSTHPDLTGNLRAESARNFVPSFVSGAVDPADWEDDNGHGTHVSGTVGAVGNNGIGVAGVMWRTGIVAARAFGVSGEGKTAWAVAALAYAAQRSRVVNGSFTFDEAAAAPAFDAVFAQYPNTLFVFAAGNEAVDVDAGSVYPCASERPNVICVAAIDPYRALADYSNFGARSVDLAAPGSAVNSTAVPVAMLADHSSTGAMNGWMASPDTTAASWHLVSGGLPVPYAMTYTPTAVPHMSTVALASPAAGLPLLTGPGCRVDYLVGGRLPVGIASARFEARHPAIASGAWVGIEDPFPVDAPARIEPRSADLSDFGGLTGVQVRLAVTNTSGTGVSFGYTGGPNDIYLEVEQVQVRCVGPQPSAGTYAQEDGTSMAAPHVAGAAALLLSRDPSLTVAGLREAILGTVRPSITLAGRTVTGGHLDLAAAMARVAGPPAGGPPGSSAPAARVVPMALRVRGRAPVRLGVRRDAVRVPMECVGTATARCRVTVTLRHQVRVAGSRTLRWRTLASTSVERRAGWTGSIILALNAHAKRTLATRPALAAQVVAVRRIGATGITTTATVTLAVRGT